ncbi:hypothetical protein EMIHUDRAFT_451733 [Emiliania huxleyi CCMP1516]|uniref:MPN domain-containing protein n=2 Tax=Emiliania huxleyi TaxID=2903 RepID=A0A0D3IVS7_EMIH1|nr:hypothetical protein EMIHUDRAFT_451733 [Emiliania huxleyi CCMP1516]EOD15362.1 hypothetical protein EMIHUDRAFT_451733 [Emiliania huxleyi CCMP1516]|eukprot:XP_005767791.1 hypothetical protein EMIHUDRAFT_451733 [Emiliania huxleyi CCMP1516]
MSATTSIEVQPEAYCLMFLHACKYPARAVNGLLLGTAAGDSVKVQKALPLFHSSFALSPMLETALMLADEHCKSSGKLQVVGYYQANELCDDLELGPFGKKIAQKIRSVCPLAACLLIDGARMQPTAREPGLLPLDADGKRSAAALSLPDAAAVQRLDAYLQHGGQHLLVDFDAHLDDATKDWLGNSALLSSA